MVCESYRGAFSSEMRSVGARRRARSLPRLHQIGRASPQPRNDGIVSPGDPHYGAVIALDTSIRQSLARLDERDLDTVLGGTGLGRLADAFRTVVAPDHGRLTACIGGSPQIQALVLCPLTRCPENYGNSAQRYIELLINSAGIISLATFTIGSSTSVFREAAWRTISRTAWPQLGLQGVRFCSDALFGFI